MARIYLASTYKDLSEVRGTVYGALRAMGHDVIAMEHWVAADVRPLARCKSEIERCDLVIGLIAWRYGHRPRDPENPSDRSITELELIHASERAIPRLLFLREGPPPARLARRDRRDLERLRRGIERDSSPGRFRDRVDLIDGLVKATRDVVPDASPPHLQGLLMAPFVGNKLTLVGLGEAADKLTRMMQRTGFEPDLIVGLNQSGAVLVAMISRRMPHVPVALAKTETDGGEGKRLGYLSLPRGAGGAPLAARRVLVVDSKLKSGGSLCAIDAWLRANAGAAEVRYGVVLAYCDPTSLKAVDLRQPWHVRLPKLDATGYVAYHLHIDLATTPDPVWEVTRPGSEVVE